jgi:uncharacterized protein YjbI with pentapeptide repeats
MKTNSKKNASAENSKEKLKNALDLLKKSVNLDEIISKSTELVNKLSDQLTDQIGDKVPQKIQNHFLVLGFSANISGIDSKLSMLKAVNIGNDNNIHDNQVTGSQWFGVSISNKSEMQENKFAATQLTEFSLSQSDFCACNISLARMSHVTIQESCFVNNKITLSTWSDTNLTESDFTQNTLSRSNFSGLVINASRLSNLKLNLTDFTDCEVDACDIQGFEFDNCEFEDCSFSQITANSTSPIKVTDCRFIGKQFTQCKSAEDFYNMLMND